MKHRRASSTLRAVLPVAVAAIVATGAVSSSGQVYSQDKVSKFLLIKLSRDQSKVLCTSEEFTSCMGFTEQACNEISESALQQCILPLPDTIDLAELDNDVLEACPQKVYADAGFSDEKAVMCLQKAINK